MSPAVPPCHAWLIPQADPDQPVEIGSGVCIGRKDSCRIKIASATISAVQCEVKWNPQQQCFQLIDRSSNGTFLNGRLVTPFNDKSPSPTRLTDGDQVQLTKSWQQNLALQFTFVTSVVKLGGSVKVKQPNDSDEKIESLVGENGENHAHQGSHDVSDLQKTLEELEAYNLSLSTQLMEAKEQLRKAESKVAQPEVESERIKLLAQVDEALKETAREEGIGSANRELIDECHKVHENLEMQLKELILRRDPLGHEKRRCEENTTACRAVERRVRDMTAAKEADIKDLHQQAQGLVFDINVHGTQCLSQCAVPDNDDEVKLEADPIPPAKRCRVEVLSIDGVFAETIALG